jgi:hypothetical protein
MAQRHPAVVLGHNPSSLCWESMRTQTLRSNREESVRGAAGSLDFSSSGGDVNGTREDARPGRVRDGYRTD